VSGLIPLGDANALVCDGDVCVLPAASPAADPGTADEAEQVTPAR
jgi:hypothetical protein